MDGKLVLFGVVATVVLFPKALIAVAVLVVTGAVVGATKKPA